MIAMDSITSPVQQALILCLAQHGPLCKQQLAEMIQRSMVTVSRAILQLNCTAKSEVVRLLPDSSEKYALAKELCSMPMDQLQDLLGISSTDPAQVASGNGKTHRTPGQRLARNPDAVEFFKLNAPYLTRHQIAAHLHVGHETVAELATILGYGDEQLAYEDHASDVSRDFGFLPLGSTVTQWINGTSIKVPCSTEGYVRIVRHYTG